MKRRYRVISRSPHAMIGQVGKFDLICFGHGGQSDPWPRVALRWSDETDARMTSVPVNMLDLHLTTRRDLVTEEEQREIVRIAETVAMPVALGLNVKRFK